VARRWREGHTLAEIGRGLGIDGSCIRHVVCATGGFTPPERRRSRLALTLSEREEISRGVAAGETATEIARRLGRAPSTITRELGRHGGRVGYRARTLTVRPGTGVAGLRCACYRASR
jgi:DNA-binding CsgD family transcriptional regulator